jgi:hypothetical protein
LTAPLLSRVVPLVYEYDSLPAMPAGGGSSGMVKYCCAHGLIAADCAHSLPPSTALTVYIASAPAPLST